MTSPGTYSAGTAYLDVIPAFGGMQRAIAKKVREMEAALGDAAGDEFGDRFEKKVNKAVDRALGTSKDRARTAGRDAGEEYGGLFERAVQQRIKAALSNFPKVKFDADLTPAEAKIQELRAKMQALGDKKIDVDIDGRQAIAEMEAIRAELAAMAKNKDLDFKVRADAAGAAAELLSIRSLAKLIDETKVEVKVDLDENGIRAKLTALRATILSAGSGGQEGANAFRAFNGVILAATTLLPAVIPLLGATAGALALIGPMAAGAGAGIAVTALAFSGIGTAVKALNDVENNRAKDSVAAAKKMRTAAESVADAQRSVEKATTSASRANTQAARAVEDAVKSQRQAEQDLTRAQEDRTRAQEAVTRAMKAAREEQEDLALAVRGGALDERDAIADLADAQEAYNASLNDPEATAKDRDALLRSLEREQYNLDRIRESNGDLAEQQAEATRTGVEGSAQVVAAQQGVADANDRVKDAQDRLADAAVAVSDAVDAQRQVQVDSAAQIQEAQRNLTNAQENYTTALYETGTQGSASMQALNEAMGALGPAGQAFAIYLQSIRGEMRELRDLAQAGVLPGVQDAIEMILTNNGPELKQFISDMAFVVGDLFRKTGELFTSPEWQGIFDVWGETAPIFLQQMGDVGLAALTFFGELFRGLAPYAVIFGDQLVRMADASADWMGEFVDSQEFRDIMDWLFTNGPIVWDTLVDLGHAIFDILVALAPFGTLVLQLLDSVAEFIIQMDPKVLGAVAVSFLGMVASFQIAMGAVTIATLAIDGVLGALTGWILVIGAVATGMVVLYTQSETFRTIVDAVFGFIADWWGVVFDIFGEVIDFFKEGGPLQRGTLAVIYFFRDLPGKIGEFLSQLPGTIAYWLGVAVGNLAEWGILALVALYSALPVVGEWFKNLPGVLWDFFKIGGGLDTWFMNFIADFGSGSGNALAAMGQWFADLPGNLWDFVSKENALDRLGMAIIEGIMGGIAWAWTHFWDWLKGLWDSFIQGFKDSFGIASPSKVFFELGAWLIQGLLDGINSLVGLVVAGFVWLKDQAVEKFTWLRDLVMGIVTDFVDRVIRGFANMGQAVIDGFLWLRDQAVEKFTWLRDGVVNLAQQAWDWTVDKFTRMKDGVISLFDQLVQGVKNVWAGIRRVAADPINFVINTVLNNGLFAAWGKVIDTLGLNKDWKLHIDPIDTTGLAAGGRVPGYSPNDRADNIPAMLTAGEHVQPVKRVRQYGMDLFEAFRAGAIDPRAARALLPGRQAYADGGPVYQQIFSAVKKRWPSAKLNDGYRPGASDLHGAGLAVDLGETGFAGGIGRPYLAMMNRDLFDRAGRYIAELIYDGAGDDRPDLKNGNPLNYGAATSAAHKNHVHLGVRDLVGFLRAYGAGDGGGLTKGYFDGGSLLGGIWDSVTGVFNSIKDSIAAPLRAFGENFPASDLVRLPTEMVKQMPAKLWDAAKDKVTNIAGSLWGGATDLATWLAGNDTTLKARNLDRPSGGTVEALVRSAAAKRGWDQGAQWNALSWIINHESSWNPNAQNPSSTAYGLFQFLNGTWAGTGVSKTSDPGMQAVAGMNYIASRYRDPVSAQRFWAANGWYADGGPVTPDSKGEAPTLYDSGGWLPPGITTVLNATNKPEPILTGEQWAEMTRRGDDDGAASTIGELHLHEVQHDLSEAVETVNHWANVYNRGGRYTTVGSN